MNFKSIFFSLLLWISKDEEKIYKRHRKRVFFLFQMQEWSRNAIMKRKSREKGDEKRLKTHQRVTKSRRCSQNRSFIAETLFNFKHAPRWIFIWHDFYDSDLDRLREQKYVLKMEILQRKLIPAMTSNLYLTHINKIANKKVLSPLLM